MRQRDPYTASGDVLIDPMLSARLVPPTDEQRQAARRAVCERAEDVEDARRLLEMLGLLAGARHQGVASA